ncbi:MAG: response regulator transcription factor [Flavobacteriales bacterium]|nr:response regulator transcription factor [Flavobacteriales bacterium]
MRRIEVLIVEDEQEELDELIEFCEDSGYIPHPAKSEEETIELFRQKSIDIAILDIYLEGKPKGLDIARMISEAGNKKCPVLFLTNSQDREIFMKAKKIAPFSFLLKPYTPLEVEYAIELAVERHIEEQNQFDWNSSAGSAVLDQNFLLKKRGRLVKVLLSEVVFITVEGRYCSLITDHGQFLIQSSMNNLMDRLPKQLFVRTHRNYAANINRVKEVFVADNLIVMDNDETVFLSNSHKDSFYERYQLLK